MKNKYTNLFLEWIETFFFNVNLLSKITYCISLKFSDDSLFFSQWNHWIFQLTFFFSHVIFQCLLQREKYTYSEKVIHFRDNGIPFSQCCSSSWHSGCRRTHRDPLQPFKLQRSGLCKSEFYRSWETSDNFFANIPGKLSNSLDIHGNTNKFLVGLLRFLLNPESCKDCLV